MKKTLSIILTILMLFSFTTVAFAADYDQIFDAGQNGSKTYRIPAIYTLNDGSVIAAADMRYDHGVDSPGNIDTLVAISENGYTDWNYNVINYFGDYPDTITATASASFIDTAIVQSKTTNRIFTVVDVQPSGCGYLQCKQGTGFTTINGNRYMLLTTGKNTDALNTFKYYIGDFAKGFAPILELDTGAATGFFVDTEFDLYEGTKAIKTTQAETGKEINNNIYFANAPFKCYCTTYLWMRYSDDNGKTWSDPVNLSGQVKQDGEYFLGICPGRGFAVTLKDKDGNSFERIIFTVYDNGNIGWNGAENVSTIYSDDNGVTWNRGEETYLVPAVGKTSESQMVEHNNGVLRLYARNKGDHIAYADSTDGGVTWTDFVTDSALTAMGNCMCSFINTSKTINGKPVILGSFPSNSATRADGVIKVGLVNNDNSVDWISTYRLTYNSFFAYSCMTELSDGNFAILYEDEAAHIANIIFSVDGNGNIQEINGNNPVSDEDVVEKELTFWEKIVKFFSDLLYKIQKFFGLA